MGLEEVKDNRRVWRPAPHDNADEAIALEDAKSRGPSLRRVAGSVRRTGQ
jgi:hypothetical protein